MKNSKTNESSFLGFIIKTLILVAFIFGIYTMITNDKYSKSNVFIGVIFFQKFIFFIHGQGHTKGTLYKN